MSDDWLTGDPFANPDDPAAREREQRRLEREEKRRGRAPKEEPAPAPPPPVATSEPEPDPEPEFHDDGHPEMAGAARSGRRFGDGGGGHRGGPLGAIARHPFRIFAVIAALFVLWSLNALFQPFHGDGSGRVQVTVPKGSSVSEVGDLLAKKDVIDNSTLFQVRVTLAGKRSEIYSGHFTLAHNMSYGAAIDALSTPPLKRTVTVTIPEGYTRSQAA
ncbi:MAG TPA: endolytic transglycosylase MltG, partial [Solirubrobacterales bacterium]